MNSKSMFGLALCLLLAIAFIATPAFAVTIDGTISAGEWDGAIINDGVDNVGATELGRWGAKIENGYFYWFCELGDGQTYDGTFYGTGRRVFPSILMDVDCSTDTYIGYNDADNIVDDDGMVYSDGQLTEWAVNHRGVDIALQVQHSETWTNGDPIAYGYGGTGGTASNALAVAIDGTTYVPSYGGWCTNGNVMEASISMARLESIVASLNHPRDTTVGDYISLAVGMEGNVSGSISWGLDVDTPIILATDPVNNPLLSGDANLDGKVDGSDVTILAGNWQAGVAATDYSVTWRSGDFNGDGKVDGSDVTILAGNWQAGVSSATASVPEPGTVMLLLSAAATLLLWYKRR